MKKLMIAIMILTLVGCTSQTKYGSCIGVMDDKEATLKYKPDAWNIFWGVVFIETIIVPLVVILDETQCPVGKKVGN